MQEETPEQKRRLPHRAGVGGGLMRNGTPKTANLLHLVQISIRMAGTILHSQIELCKLCIMHTHISVFLTVTGKSHLFKITGAN